MALLREGQIVRDTYEVERLLGEGAFAEVYRVQHRFLGRQAMKVFKMSGLQFKDLEEMLGEALILSRLGHPHITRVFEANTTETTRGTCGFFTMEYVVGGSLEQYWQTHGKQSLAVANAVEVVRQVSSGLAQAHGEKPPIIHRDVKPANILVAADEGKLHVRLTDFGLAKRVNAINQMTQAHGTLTFKAPESFRGHGSDSCAGDVWALGCTLYWLLTNEMPYPEGRGARDEGREMGEGPATGRYHSLVPPGRLNVNVDRDLDEIVSRALAVDPKDRYVHAGQMLESLVRWQQHAPAAKAPTVAEVPTPESQQVTPEEASRKLVAEALQLGRQYSKLSMAIQLMEAAIRQDPSLQDKYQDQLDLWRRGIVW